ncbi:hypothetical protein [uncultured Faecalibaculum sp.]|nr:hypothetical protein [uncultured Faecalibaculum sp.]
MSQRKIEKPELQKTIGAEPWLCIPLHTIERKNSQLPETDN